ncbi:MAG: hypothetical protein ACLQID_13485, partial [Streptosporangiaceae bacterium]
VLEAAVWLTEKINVVVANRDVTLGSAGFVTIINTSADDGNGLHILNGGRMIVVGVRCTKDTLDWVVVDGAERSLASITEQRKVTAPVGQRGGQLAWVRKEVLELLERHAVEAAAVRVAEGGGQSVSLGRSEVEGVVQEAFASAGVPQARHVAVTIRSAYGARTKADLAPIFSAVPAIEATGVSRREPVVSAVALLPS